MNRLHWTGVFSDATYPCWLCGHIMHYGDHWWNDRNKHALCDSCGHAYTEVLESARRALHSADNSDI